MTGREPGAGDHPQGFVLPPLTVGDGALADNIVYFARALRRAGLRVGPASVTDAIEAAIAIGVGSREEFHAALSAVFVKRHEDQQVFDEAFRLYWRARDYVSQMMAMMLPIGARKQPEKQKAGSARLGDAFFDRKSVEEERDEPPEVIADARFTVSGNEVLRQMDFAQMSAPVSYTHLTLPTKRIV